MITSCLNDINVKKRTPLTTQSTDNPKDNAPLLDQHELGHWEEEQWRILDRLTRTLLVSDVRLRLTGWLDTVRAAFSWSRAAGIFILQLTHCEIVPHFAVRKCVTEVGRLKTVWMITLHLWWVWLQTSVLREDVSSPVIVHYIQTQ